MKKGALLLLLSCTYGLSFSTALASSQDGTIDTTSKFASGVASGVGLVNFGTIDGNVHVTDAGMTGYAWSETAGWINLAPSGYGVTNNAEGTLGGYAWGENTGWINFAPSQGGVTIDSSGIFHGYAWSTHMGWISFNCLDQSLCGTNNYSVVTDWRKRSTRPQCSNNIDDDSDGQIDMADSGCSSPSDTTEATSGGGGGPGGGGDTPPGGGDTPPGGGGDTPPGGGDTPPGGGGDTPPGGGGTPPGDTGGGTPPSGGGGGTTPPSGGGGGGGGVQPVPIIPPTPPSTGIVNTISNAISDIFTNTSQNFQNAVISVQKTAEAVSRQVGKVVTSDTGSIVTKTVTSAGVVGTGVATASTLFLNPLSFGEMALIPIRLWGLLLTALGIRKRNRPWGVVYDSVTKQPLDPAYVTLLDMADNEIASSITDLDGRYGFLLTQGIFKLNAQKTNYRFPSIKLKGKTSDELYSNLYFGEPLDVRVAGEVLRKNIPLDPINFDWNEFAKGGKKLTTFYSRWSRIVSKITSIFFLVGLVLSVVAYYFAPEPYNIVIFVIYVIMLILRIVGIRPKTYGFLIEKITGISIPYGIIRVFSAETDIQIAEKVADAEGRYYCLIPARGLYYLTVERKNLDETYTRIYKSGTQKINKGVLSDTIIA